LLQCGLFPWSEMGNKVKKPNQTILKIVVFITSFSILGYEIIFTRIFAYAQWHNLSVLIITMALLGFGTSGCMIALLQEKVEAEISKYLFMAALLFPLFYKHQVLYFKRRTHGDAHAPADFQLFD